MVLGTSSAESFSTLVEDRLRQVEHMRVAGSIEQEAVRIADQRMLERSGLANTNHDLAHFNTYCARRELLWGTGKPIAREWSRTRLQALRNTVYNCAVNVVEVMTTCIAWTVSLRPKYALSKAQQDAV